MSKMSSYNEKNEPPQTEPLASASAGRRNSEEIWIEFLKDVEANDPYKKHMMKYKQEMEKLKKKDENSHETSTIHSKTIPEAKLATEPKHVRGKKRKEASTQTEPKHVRGNKGKDASTQTKANELVKKKDATTHAQSVDDLPVIENPDELELKKVNKEEKRASVSSVLETSKEDCVVIFDPPCFTISDSDSETEHK